MSLKRNSTYSHRNSRLSGNLDHGGIGLVKRTKESSKWLASSDRALHTSWAALQADK